MSRRKRSALLLFSELEQKARQEGLLIGHLARKLGLSYSYYAALKSGQEPLAKASWEFLRACARYLDTSLIQVMLLGDMLNLEDFLPRTRLKEFLDLALLKIRADPELRTLAPTLKDWGLTPDAVKLRFILLYDKCYAQTLLQGTDALPWSRNLEAALDQEIGTRKIQRSATRRKESG
jgi:transcriptional regulator with XRE-family HTH domain